jgi:hypothetical protein
LHVENGATITDINCDDAGTAVKIAVTALVAAQNLTDDGIIPSVSTTPETVAPPACAEAPVEVQP